MPVHESSVGVLLPRPDMQSVKSRKPKAIGSFEEMEQLTHELRWAVRMRGIPGISQDNKLDSGKFQAAIRLRLIEHGLWTRRVQHSAADQRAIHVVKTHCARIRPAHAAERKLISRTHGDLHILEARSCFPDHLD